MKDWEITFNWDTNKIAYVTKLSTGEKFYEGDKVWHLEYEQIIGPIRFDEALTGHRYFKDGDWYEGYFRADSGIYPIEKLSVHKLSGSTDVPTLSNMHLIG